MLIKNDDNIHNSNALKSNGRTNKYEHLKNVKTIGKKIVNKFVAKL